MLALLAQSSTTAPATQPVASDLAAEAAAVAEATPLLEHPAGLLAVLLAVLAIIFWLTQRPVIGRLFKVVPALVFCYFVPTTLTTLGIIPDASPLYSWIKAFVLPASLLLLILALDLPAIIRLGPKAVIMLFAGTTGVVIGGPISLLICGRWLPEDAWRGMAALAGSWIGGGANFVAIGEAARVSPSMLGTMVVPDVILASIWMGTLLYLSGHQKRIDAFTGANTSAILDLQRRMSDFQERVTRIPGLPDLLLILAFAFMGSWASYRIGVAIDDAMEQQLTVPAVVLRTTVDGADTRTQLAADPENDDAVTLFLSVERHQSDEGAANVDDDTAPVDSSTEVQEHKIRLDWPSVAKVEELVKYVREQVPGWSAELLNGDGTDGLRPASDLRHFSSAQVGSDGLVLRVSDARHPGLWNFHISVSSGTWKYIIVTALGVLLSFTRARNLEGAGASKMGSLMIYLLVACIGASANFARIVEAPALILMGAIWIATHIGVLLLVAWLIKAPIFFVAVGSQANIGGAASAPVVASAFHPSLAPVGALLAVAGYVLGTYAGLVCMQLLKMVSDSGTLPPG